MSVKVEYVDNHSVIYDNANTWKMDEFGNLEVLNSANTVALHAKDTFLAVKKVDTEDKNILLAEAKELIQTVDDGDWTNQESDWVDKAQEFVDRV